MALVLGPYGWHEDYSGSEIQNEGYGGSEQPDYGIVDISSQPKFSHELNQFPEGQLLGWDQVDQSDFDMAPWNFAHDTGFYPKGPDGQSVPYDELTDWYYNNPDAQFYIQNYLGGGNGDLSQPPPSQQPPQSQPPPAQPSTPSGATGDTSLPTYTPRDYATGYAPYGAGWPAITNSDDPFRLAQENRIQSGAWGDLLDQSLRDYGNTYQNYEGNARDRAYSGEGGYGNILSGGAGFSPEEQKQILQEEMLRNGMASQGDLDALNLEQWEIERILGDPYAAQAIIQGRLEAMDAAQTDAQKRQREAYTDMANRLDSAIDPNALRTSEEWNRDFAFGDADVDALAEQASRNIQTSAAARNQSLGDAAFAQGNTSPLALAAAQARTRVQGDVAAQDAITDARLKGKGLQLDVAASRENTRLGTERDISDRMTGAGALIGQTRLGAEQRIGADQQALGQYGTNLAYDATKYGDAAQSERAATVAANRQNIGTQNLNTRFGQAGQASTALSSRYGQIAGQKKAEEAEGRKFLTEQQGMAQAGAQNMYGQRTGLYGTRLSGLNTATGQVINAKNLPTALDKGLGFVGGLIGGGGG